MRIEPGIEAVLLCRLLRVLLAGLPTESVPRVLTSAQGGGKTHSGTSSSGNRTDPRRGAARDGGPDWLVTPHFLDPCFGEHERARCGATGAR